MESRDLCMKVYMESRCKNKFEREIRNAAKTAKFSKKKKLYGKL